MTSVSEGAAPPAEDAPPPVPLWHLALTIAAVCAFYWHYLDPTTMMSGGDFSNLFWPGKVFLKEAWAQGVVPLWNPWNYFGTPFAATLQHGVFYPIDWLIFAALPAGPGLNFYVLLHLCLCAAGMLWWVHRATPLRSWPAVFFAAAYPCSSWFWAKQEHINQLATTAWTPWLLLLAWNHGTGRLGAWRFVWAYSIVSALQFLAGHPQGAAYTHLFAAAVLLWHAWGRRGGLPMRLAKGIVPLAVAGVVSLALSAPQLLPTLELSRQTLREVKDAGDFRESYARAYSMPPDVLATAVFPHYFGSFREGFRRLGPNNDIPDLRAYNEYGIYQTMPVYLLALLGVAWGARGGRTPARFLGVACLLLVLLALGSNADPRVFFPAIRDFLAGRVDSQFVGEFPSPGFSLHDLFLMIFPPAQGFRAPGRVLMVYHLAILTLAAIGLHALLAVLTRRGASAWSRSLVSAGLVTAGAALLVIPSMQEKFRFPADSTALDVLVEADTTGPVARTLDDRLFRMQLLDDDVLAKSEREFETTFRRGNPLAVRWERLQPNMHMVVHAPMDDGYEEGLSPTVRTKDFVQWFNRNFRQFEPDAQLLALLGVGRILADPPVNREKFPLAEAGGAGVPRPYLRNPLHRGAAFWEAQARGIAFGALDGPARFGFGYRNERNTRGAVPIGEAPDWTRPWPRLRTVVKNPNQVRVVKESNDAPSAIILALGYAPDWFVLEQRDIENYDRRLPLRWINAVHARFDNPRRSPREIVLAYEPASYRSGMFIAAVTVMLLTFLGCISSAMPPSRPRE